MNVVTLLERAAAEGVRLIAKDGRITWEAGHQPPPDLLECLREQRQAILDALTRQRHQYREAVAEAAGVPWEWLAARFFTPEDLIDMEAGHYPNPVAVGELIRANPAHPFGWNTPT